VREQWQSATNLTNNEINRICYWNSQLQQHYQRVLVALPRRGLALSCNQSSNQPINQVVLTCDSCSSIRGQTASDWHRISPRSSSCTSWGKISYWLPTATPIITIRAVVATLHGKLMRRSRQLISCNITNIIKYIIISLISLSCNQTKATHTAASQLLTLKVMSRHMRTGLQKPVWKKFRYCLGISEFTVSFFITCTLPEQIGHFCNFQTSTTLTLTLYLVIRHTIVYHSLTSIYITNFLQIGKTFCGQTDGFIKLTTHKN